MADANNKLRLQIVTQLDAAGIKATKEQVDSLELGLRRAGNAGSESGQKFGQLEKALGNLPGPIGKIGGALGGLGGQAAMVIGAFKLGWDIGDWIQEHCIAPLFGIKDPIEELKKENKEYERQLQSLKESLEEVTAAEMKRMDASAASAEKALKRIDEQTAAYFRQVTSLEGLKKAEGNAEMIQLERSKFEDMKAYSDAGYGEAAEQIGKYYDVLEAELSAKQQIEAFDRESAKLESSRVQDEAAYEKALQRAADAKQKQVDAEAELDEHRRKNSINGSGYYSSNEDALKDDQLEKIAQRAAKDSARADEILAKRAAKLETADADNLARQMERANLVASGTLGVDRAAQSYDDFVAEKGNPLGAEIDANWAADLLSRTIEADQTQQAILSEVKAFGEMWRQALGM